MTIGGAKEKLIDQPFFIGKKILEIRRVCHNGYGLPFTPNLSSKHADLKYFKRNPVTAVHEEWNPWRDKEPEAWALEVMTMVYDPSKETKITFDNGTQQILETPLRRKSDLKDH